MKEGRLKEAGNTEKGREFQRREIEGKKPLPDMFDLLDMFEKNKLDKQLQGESSNLIGCRGAIATFLRSLQLCKISDIEHLNSFLVWPRLAVVCTMITSHCLVNICKFA